MLSRRVGPGQARASDAHAVVTGDRRRSDAVALILCYMTIDRGPEREATRSDTGKPAKRPLQRCVSSGPDAWIRAPRREGSHRVFKRKGEPVQLNFQDRDGYIPPYQGRQLVRMIEKHGSGS
jgi:hypothetical protein